MVTSDEAFWTASAGAHLNSPGTLQEYGMSQVQTDGDSYLLGISNSPVNSEIGHPFTGRCLAYIQYWTETIKVGS